MADGVVFRNLWGPWQQVARRHLTEQTSVTQGTTDADPTIRRVTGGEPYQIRSRDSTVAVVEANRAWFRKTLNSNDLGLADSDPTVRPLWAPANPHSLRFRDPTAGVVGANRAWQLDRLTSNDLGVADADPTIHAPWQQSNPYQLRFRDPTVGAVEAMEQWFRKTLNSNDLGLADADPTIRQPWQAANPYQLRTPPNDIPAIEAWAAQLHLWQASTPVSPSTDADPTVHPLWAASHPYQLHRLPYPPTLGTLAQYRLWQATVPPATPFTIGVLTASAAEPSNRATDQRTATLTASDAPTSTLT